jgi:hypothetical protein
MSAIIFVVSLPISRLSLFWQQSPAAPYWMKSAITDDSYAASQTLILKLIHSKAIVSRLDLYWTVLCTMTSYAAADCHFLQDAHSRMASVIARIRRAEARERGECAQDHQSVNGEKLFMSLTAECTEVEYATELYSESPPPVGTKTDKGDTVTRRGAEVLHCAYKWSSILQATKPQLPPDLYICGKFTAGLTTTKCSSAGLLTARSSFAMQSTLPWAKETLLHLRQFVPLPSFATCPYSTA